MPRAQVAFEFIAMLTLALVIGVVFLVSANALVSEQAEEDKRLALNDIGYQIQDEIILAMTVQDGYARTFLIPQKAQRFAYTLTSTPSSVTLRSGSLVLTFELPPTSGTLAKGTNTLRKNTTVTVTQP